MPRTMEECHELGHHADYPRRRCPDCQANAAELARRQAEDQADADNLTRKAADPDQVRPHWVSGHRHPITGEPVHQEENTSGAAVCPDCLRHPIALEASGICAACADARRGIA